MKTRNFGLMVAALTALCALTGCDPVWSVETSTASTTDRTITGGPLDPAPTTAYIKAWSCPEGYIVQSTRPSGAAKMEWKDVLTSARAELATVPVESKGELFVHAWKTPGGTVLQVTRLPGAQTMAWSQVLDSADQKQQLAQK